MSHNSGRHNSAAVVVGSTARALRPRGPGCVPSANMPQCARPKRWVTRSQNVCLRSRTAKRLAQAPAKRLVPARKRRPRKKKPKRPPLPDPIEEKDFLYGHAFDVLLALGLVPNKDRIKQENESELT